MGQKLLSLLESLARILLRATLPGSQKIPKLTATEERELVKRWFKKRDEKARERLITANLYLVLPIAKKWAYRFFNNDKAVDELIAEGNLA